jgi:acyl-CoA thioesterase FadM
VAYFAAILILRRRMDDSSAPAASLPTSPIGTGSGTEFPWSTRCRYRAPVRFDDLLTLRTRVARVEEKGATFGFSLFRTGEGKDILAAEGKISCRAIDATWKTIPLPPELKAVL